MEAVVFPSVPLFEGAMFEEGWGTAKEEGHQTPSVEKAADRGGCDHSMAFSALWQRRPTFSSNRR
jgi:hypothetical protein